VFLERARADAEAQGANVRWIEGDMRKFSFEDQFDAVINIFTAFGYFEDPKDDLKTLISIREALKPTGRFLLETIHRDSLPARFQTKGFDWTSRGSIVLRERQWDLARDVIDEDLLLIRPDGSRTKYKSAVRVRSLHQYLALVHEAGLDTVAWYGGLDGSPLELTSRRLVLLSQRAASDAT
jgi:SAM-dependent methyltransferase